MTWQRAVLFGLRPLFAVRPSKMYATFVSERSRLNRFPGTPRFDSLRPELQLRDSIKIPNRVVGNDIVVKLDVGGVRFETSLSTLTRYPESLLGRWFLAWDSKEERFIDFDGATFGFVLDFLRHGPSMVLPTDVETMEKLCFAAEYFQLTELKELMAAEFTGLVGKNLANGDLVKFSRYGIQSLNKGLLSHAFLSYGGNPILGGLHPDGDVWKAHCPGCNTTGASDRTWSKALEASSKAERFTLLNSMKQMKLAVKEDEGMCVSVKQVGASCKFHIAKTFLTHY